MSWFRVDDGFHQHPKVMKAGNAAVGLWVRGGSYSSQYLLDGFVPDETISNYGRPKEIAMLITTRLWVPGEGGMFMPDFLEYNPSADSVRRARKKAAARQADGRAAAAARRGEEDPFA